MKFMTHLMQVCCKQSNWWWNSHESYISK